MLDSIFLLHREQIFLCLFKIFGEIYANFLSQANMKFMHEFNISFEDAIDEHDVLFILHLITKYNFI